MTDSTLNRFVAYGTTTQKNAFTPSPPTPASGPSPGYTWWDTTLLALYCWDAGSSSWKPALTVSGSSFVGCKAYNSASLSISNNAATALTFDSEQFDTDSIHSTSLNTSRFTIPSGKDGKWRFSYSGGVWQSNGAGQRLVWVKKNGSDQIGGQSSLPGSSVASANQNTGTVTLNLVAGDYVELYVYQASGSTLTIGDNAGTSPNNAATMECQYLGP